MGFFSFNKKIETAKELSLGEISVFSSLNPAELRDVEKKARLQEFKRGDLVYTEGTAAEFFYVVVSGRFHVFTGTRGGQSRQTLLQLYRGDHFGETSLLTGKLHSASVEAKSDGVVLKFEKEDFLKFVQATPALLLHLTRSLGHRLTKSQDASGNRREVKITALYPESYPQESFIFWVDFSAKLARETARKVVVVDFSEKEHPHFYEEFQSHVKAKLDLEKADLGADSGVKPCLYEHRSGFVYLPVSCEKGNGALEKKVSSLLTFLTYRFDYIMVRLSHDKGHPGFQALKQTDVIYFYQSAEAGALVKAGETLKELQQNFGFGKTDIKVLIHEPAGGAEFPFEELENRLEFRIFSMIPPRQERGEKYHGIVRFLARELSEKLIGLALGSGAAYGLSHIGLIRVLEREKIPIDVIAGASIGALIGGFWAAGFNAERLLEVAKSINKTNAFFKLIGFQDLSLAHRGFFKGNQMSRFLEGYVGNMTFQDLNTPVKIIAADLFTSEEVIFESGRIVDAIRASSSIPGIFRPFRHRGMCLIDGGVIDPLPTRVLTRMGVKKIIAANVLSSAQDRAIKSKRQELAHMHRLRELAQKNPLGKAVAAFMYKLNKHYADNTFNVIMNTIQFMEYELAEAAGRDADVLLHPDVHEGHWAEFYSPEKFIAAGEECAMKNLDAIKQLLKD